MIVDAAADAYLSAIVIILFINLTWSLKFIVSVIVVVVFLIFDACERLFVIFGKINNMFGETDENMAKFVDAHSIFN